MTYWNSFHNTLAAYGEIRIGCQTFFNNFQHTSRGVESVTPETKGRSDVGETVFSHHADQVDCHGRGSLNQPRRDFANSDPCNPYRRRQPALSASLPERATLNREPGGECCHQRSVSSTDSVNSDQRVRAAIFRYSISV